MNLELQGAGVITYFLCDLGKELSLTAPQSPYTYWMHSRCSIVPLFLFYEEAISSGRSPASEARRWVKISVAPLTLGPMINMCVTS